MSPAADNTGDDVEAAAPRSPRQGQASNRLEGLEAKQRQSSQKEKGKDAAKTNGKQQAANGAPGPASSAVTEPKLSGAELKKRQKAEKAARREREKQERGGATTTPAAGEAQNGPPGSSTSVAWEASSRKAEKQQQQKQQKATPDNKTLHPRTGSTGLTQRPANLPVRSLKSAPQPTPEQQPKRVPLFAHLTTAPRRHSLLSPVPAPASVHPDILTLGLQISSYTICGSNARCVATLLAFKSVIQSYTIPSGQSFSLHFNKYHLPPQVEYLKSCRPLSVSQGNAIRWLKIEIGHIDPSTPETTAKANLCAAIDTFIRERITVADRVIASTAASKISHDDVILTFGKSSIVQRTLLHAHHLGTKFRVIVVDSRPLFEGRNLARFLANQGIEVQYCLITAAAHAVAESTKCFLGAQSMMSNGRLYSRVGTALVAMLAADRDIPVIVCCESVKFTDKVALDSIVNNEVAPPDELLEPTINRNAASGAGGGDDGTEVNVLKNWHEVPNLQLLNIMYDVTPAEYIKMVITEYGSLPPSSVPVVHRLGTDLQGRGMG